MRERPQKIDKKHADKPKPKGRPRKDEGEERPIKFNVARQCTQCLKEMLKEIPTDLSS